MTNKHHLNLLSVLKIEMVLKHFNCSNSLDSLLTLLEVEYSMLHLNTKNQCLSLFTRE
jgi:hypothetical protein